MDINKVWLSGLAVSQPIHTKFPSGTPITSFTLQTNEQFTDRSDVKRLRPNLLTIESIGRSAESVANRVHQGMRYMVDGYIRQEHRDGESEFKIRTFAVYKDESNDKALYATGIQQAVSILKKSRDLKTAIKTLEDLLAAE